MNYPLYQYHTPNLLLVISGDGKIRILYTPFRVQCKNSKCGFPMGCYVFVEKIRSDSKDTLEFGIWQNFYPFYYFRIVNIFDEGRL